MGERRLVRYRSLVYDSIRWEGFALRPGDIVISTPPKCGTTWTQMICALLIFQRPLDRALSLHSPWLDKVDRPRKEVVADLEAQEHRRFIKTHTPLDGLPLDPSVTYVCVGRDPRDVALSMVHHMENMDIPAFLAARDEAAAIDGVEPAPRPERPPPPADPIERFWLWVDNPTPPTASGSSLLGTLRHLESFRDAPRTLDVVMLHYQDLKDDLEGQMRALAARLGIAVPEDRWPDLAPAATFEAMRRDADRTVPSAQKSFWHDNARFFHRGTSEQWREVLDDAGLERYRARVAELVDDDLSAWVHRPPLG